MDSWAFDRFRSIPTTVVPSDNRVETVKHIAPVLASRYGSVTKICPGFSFAPRYQMRSEA